MADQIDLLNTLLQAYQGQADTAGPYFNLASIFQPAYGQLGLTSQQQQMFGYNVPYAGGQGAPVTPAGGFFGGGTPTYGPAQPSNGATPVDPATAAAFNPFLSSSSTSTSSPSSPYYSPDSGTRIGLGHEFNDPYAGAVGPGQTAGYHPGVLDLNATALSAFGPLVTGSLLQSNPYLFDALNLQNENAFGASDLANRAGSSPILDLLNSQALSQLKSGGELSDQERRDLTQQTLAGFGSAGISHGNSAIAADLLSRDSAVRSRLQQAQSLASGVQGLNQAQLGLQGNLYNTAGGLAGNAASTATGAITNPILQVLGLGSLNATSSPSTSINNQSQLTNPFLQAGLDVAGANFNAQNAQNIADQNNSAALTGSLINAGGSILGGLFSDKRLKKNVKKVGTSPDGHKIIEWEYKTDPKKRKYHGAEAQDVEKRNPFAVVTDPISGIKAIDYTKIDVPFYEVKEAA